MVSKHFKRGHLSHDQQLQILNKIGQELLNKAPQGWAKIVYERDSVIDHSSSDYRVEDEHGANIADWGPSTLNALFRELRPGMYQNGKGTWFSMRYTISRPGKFHVEYNYDEDPHILFPTAWGYTNDLKYFPRDEEHIPAWLRQKLSEEPRMQSE